MQALKFSVSAPGARVVSCRKRDPVKAQVFNKEAGAKAAVVAAAAILLAGPATADSRRLSGAVDSLVSSPPLLERAQSGTLGTNTNRPEDFGPVNPETNITLDKTFTSENPVVGFAQDTSKNVSALGKDLSSIPERVADAARGPAERIGADSGSPVGGSEGPVSTPQASPGALLGKVQKGADAIKDKLTGSG